jgi:hypothetical protein
MSHTRSSPGLPLDHDEPVVFEQLVRTVDAVREIPAVGANARSAGRTREMSNDEPGSADGPSGESIHRPARMTPRAPSLTTRSGSPSPLARGSRKDARTVSTPSSSPPSTQQCLAAVIADNPGGRHGLTPMSRPLTLGDAVDEHIDDSVNVRLGLRGKNGSTGLPLESGLCIFRAEPLAYHQQLRGR